MHKLSWTITDNRIKQEIFKSAFPSDEALAELDDIISEYIHDQREQEMIRLLKENLKKRTAARSNYKVD